jgi:UPF0042 nucleotide-binding protein
MRVVIITGISGAGKSLAAKCLEDLGFFCIDNLPPVLIPKITELFLQSDGRPSNIAFVIDIRGGELLNDFFPGLEELSAASHSYEILFMEASDSALIKRYNESRRVHPLAKDGSLLEGLSEERKILKNIKEKADYIIDTSDLTNKQLREAISSIIQGGMDKKGMQVNIISFGFKYGIPLECDLVFDVRFLPNPYYIDKLKALSGEDAPVAEFVMGISEAGEFLSKLTELLKFLIPYYLREGKTQLAIGIGCTGGRHRSVTIAGELAKRLQDGKNRVVLVHRDINKDVRGVRK